MDKNQVDNTHPTQNIGCNIYRWPEVRAKKYSNAYNQAHNFAYKYSPEDINIIAGEMIRKTGLGSVCRFMPVTGSLDIDP